ncbi:hypothetical protein Plhal304r1_c012g0045811 [Plasmopara halstedii]
MTYNEREKITLMPCSAGLQTNNTFLLTLSIYKMSIMRLLFSLRLIIIMTPVLRRVIFMRPEFFH